MFHLPAFSAAIVAAFSSNIASGVSTAIRNGLPFSLKNSAQSLASVASRPGVTFFTSSHNLIEHCQHLIARSVLEKVHRPFNSHGNSFFADYGTQKSLFPCEIEKEALKPIAVEDIDEKWNCMWQRARKWKWWKVACNMGTHLNRFEWEVTLVGRMWLLDVRRKKDKPLWDFMPKPETPIEVSNLGGL